MEVGNETPRCAWNSATAGSRDQALLPRSTVHGQLFADDLADADRADHHRPGQAVSSLNLHAPEQNARGVYCFLFL